MLTSTSAAEAASPSSPASCPAPAPTPAAVLAPCTPAGSSTTLVGRGTDSPAPPPLPASSALASSPPPPPPVVRSAPSVAAPAWSECSSASARAAPWSARAAVLPSPLCALPLSMGVRMSLGMRTLVDPTLMTIRGASRMDLCATVASTSSSDGTSLPPSGKVGMELCLACRCSGCWHNSHCTDSCTACNQHATTVRAPHATPLWELRW